MQIRSVQCSSTVHDGCMAWGACAQLMRVVCKYELVGAVVAHCSLHLSCAGAWPLCVHQLDGCATRQAAKRSWRAITHHCRRACLPLHVCMHNFSPSCCYKLGATAAKFACLTGKALNAAPSAAIDGTLTSRMSQSLYQVPGQIQYAKAPPASKPTLRCHPPHDGVRKNSLSVLLITLAASIVLFRGTLTCNGSKYSACASRHALHMDCSLCLGLRVSITQRP